MEEVKRVLLNKLVRSRTWGGKHLPLNLLLKGLPTIFRASQQGKKAVEKAIKELEQEQIIILSEKRTGKGYDTHISLNPRKIANIQALLS